MFFGGNWPTAEAEQADALLIPGQALCLHAYALHARAARTLVRCPDVQRAPRDATRTAYRTQREHTAHDARRSAQHGVHTPQHDASRATACGAPRAAPHPSAGE